MYHISNSQTLPLKIRRPMSESMMEVTFYKGRQFKMQAPYYVFRSGVRIANYAASPTLLAHQHGVTCVRLASEFKPGPVLQHCPFKSRKQITLPPPPLQVYFLTDDILLFGTYKYKYIYIRISFKLKHLNIYQNFTTYIFYYIFLL